MSDKRVMSEISHTHPETDDSFGSVYRRGPVAADGGEDTADSEPPTSTMKDVDHTTGETVRRIWDRGATSGSQGANR